MSNFSLTENKSSGPSIGNKIEDDINEFQAYVKKNTFFNSFLNLGPCISFIYNYPLEKYLYMSDNVYQVSGHSSADFYNGGLNFFNSICHPDDIEIIVYKIYNKIFEFIKTVSPKERAFYRFTYNWRARRQDNIYIQVLQQAVIMESDNEGNPLLLCGTAVDISSYKRDGKIIFSISKNDDINGFQKIETELTKELKNNLTKRQKEIVRMVYLGDSSKMISYKLKISVNTVNNHRRNIRLKLKATNTAEMIAFCFNKGII